MPRSQNDQKTFLSKRQRATQPLELVHSYICELLNIQARRGYKYYATFIDDYSRYVLAYVMARKSEIFGTFMKFRAEVEKQLEKSLKWLRSNQGGEYLDTQFEDCLSENEILLQLTAPGTPEQNSVAERRNRTLLDMVRSMLSQNIMLSRRSGRTVR